MDIQDACNSAVITKHARQGAKLMTFDFHMHIDSQSPEGHVVESIVNRDHVSPQEAVLRVLREKGGPNPAQEMIGALSDPESIAILDEVVAEAYRLRSLDQPRDFGL